jgi:hypothetical protein
MIEDKREEINLKDRQAYLDKALAFTKECRLVINSAISTGLKVTSKPDKSLVTTADIEAEKLFTFAAIFIPVPLPVRWTPPSSGMFAYGT